MGMDPLLQLKCIVGLEDPKCFYWITITNTLSLVMSSLIRKGWFSNASFTTGLKTLPTFRPDALVFFRAKKQTRASGRNVGKVFNPVVKLVLENQPFLMPEPAEKPSLQSSLITSRSCVW